ncbi:MAG: recombination regulator RecX [Gammaproteobacteria bacterium]|nr:recombination regulator RecX [Gammaproteobacteria bacterium]
MLKKKQKPDKTAYANAIRLLAMREHSELQLYKKLQQREFDETEIGEAIERLKSENYLSDSRFAEAYLRTRKNKLYGPVKIRLELEERGVSGGIIATVMEQDCDQLAHDWFAVMQQAYDRKYAEREADDYSEKIKRCRYLQSRGFESSHITELIKL